ncbi:accessory Sec system glycosyltransferase Asp1 [Levilactobacillus brevis]|uniref:accessory Sec system glycosyltransferase Asp1 n=1 Tax=Levilactobacillus brevis TaxID=1580 RepID=UPI0039E29F09
MYYFLDNRLDLKSSGIEHAEIKRLNLFKKNGVKAKLVMCDFNRFAHQNLLSYGLSDDDYINMFDYFAGTTQYKGHTIGLKKLPIPENCHYIESNSNYEVYDGQRKLMEIFMLQNIDTVDKVKHFNGDGNCTKQDFYDTRGFKSLTQFYDTSNQHLVCEQFYRVNGSIFYEIAYEQRPDWLAATNIQLVDFKGITHSLMNIGEAFTIMLDDLNQNDGDQQSTFISDRSNVTNLPMVNMKSKAKKIEHFHNIHFRDYWDPMNSPLTYPSISNTDLLRKTDLIIVPSAQQRDDMKQRLRTQVPIVSIPVGIVSDNLLRTKHIPMRNRQSGKIIAIARLFHEKRLDDAIKAFYKSYQKNPSITLDIYGYGDSGDNFKEEKMLKDLVNSLNISDIVKFKGYTQNMDSVYNQAKLMIMSSRFEGAPLSIVEAQSHGVPVISYNTHYGPAYLIDNKNSGFVVPDGNIDSLSEKITTYFQKTQLQIKMNEAAYRNAQRFSSKNIWKFWKKYVIGR